MKDKVAGGRLGVCRVGRGGQSCREVEENIVAGVISGSGSNFYVRAAKLKMTGYPPTYI